MKRTTICSVPGCPTFIEYPDADNSSPGILRNPFYCDVHTEAHFEKHDNLEAEYEDEVVGALDTMVYGATVELETIEDLLGESDASWFRYVAEQVDLHVPALKAAVYSGEIWTAVRHALWVGLMAGHGRGAPDKIKMRSMEPLALRHIELTETRRAGGHATRKAPADDTLRASVAAKMAKNSHLSRTEACNLVGADFGISGKTVRTRTK